MTIAASYSTIRPSARRSAAIEASPLIAWPALLFSGVVVVYFLAPQESWIRYSVYLPPAFIAAEAVLRKLALAWRPVFLLALYLVFSAFSVSAHGYSWFAVRDLTFTALILLPFAFKFQVPRTIPYLLILSAAVCGLHSYFTNPAAPGDFGIGFGQSRAPLEGTFGLITPLLALYFYDRKNAWPMLLCLVLSVLMFKRIAIIGLTVACIVGAIHRLVRGDTRLQALLEICCAIALIAICVAGISINGIFELTPEIYRNIFGTTASIDNLTSGRYGIYSYVWSNYLDRQGLVQWLFGNGLGATSQMLNTPSTAFARLALLHNDWLKILIEYGLFGIAVTLIAFIRVMRANRFTLMAVIYTAILFATDNVSVYVFYWTALLLLLRVGSDTRPEAQNTDTP